MLQLCLYIVNCQIAHEIHAYKYVCSFKIFFVIAKSSLPICYSADFSSDRCLANAAHEGAPLPLVSIYPSETERCIPALQLFGRRCNYSCWEIYCRKWSDQGILFSNHCLLECLFYIVVFYFHGIPACAILTFGQNVLFVSFTVCDPPNHSLLFHGLP